MLQSLSSPFPPLFHSFVFSLGWRKFGTKEQNGHAWGVLIKLDPANPDLQCVVSVDILQPHSVSTFRVDLDEKTACNWDPIPRVITEVRKSIEWLNVTFLSV